LMPSTSLNLTKTNFSPKLIKFWGRLCFRTRLISQQIDEVLERKVLERQQDWLKVSVWRARFKTFLFTFENFIFVFSEFFKHKIWVVPPKLFWGIKAKWMKFHFLSNLCQILKRKMNYLESIYQSFKPILVVLN
jgi:hypothetical protein